MEGYTHIFKNSEEEYKKNSFDIDKFRYSSSIYGFCINQGLQDEQALHYAKNININLFNSFLNKPKGLFGYKGYENLYTKVDDLDSKHILILTFLFNNFDTSFNKIVEIGGGFGNMYRLCNNIIKCNSWDIIDLPHMIELQEYYLKNELGDIPNVNLINAYNNINYNSEIDLVIGTHSVSEFSWDIFMNYFNNVIIKGKYFYIGYNKRCPSPILINDKIRHILNNGFEIIKNFDYTEIPHAADVSYTLFLNINLKQK